MGDKSPKPWTPPAQVDDLYPVLDGNKFASTNRPTAGARQKEDLPKGQHDLQLYSLATPNGQKVGILLEELRSSLGVEYDAHIIRLGGDQFGSGFTAVNPNSKIPALVDRSPVDGGDPINTFESGSIMLYLAEKYNAFLPKDIRKRAECLNWVMWQMGGQGPITGGGFGHFFAYAPPDLDRDYPVARYGMEVKRLCSVLDQHLADRKYIVGDEYTIADMICLPWFNTLRTDGYTHPGSGRTSSEFLKTSEYHHLNRWADELVARPAVSRGLLVCRKYGKPWLHDDRFKHLANL
eukprot:m.159134 g.159134  ORF g.159134 m.159134 type:complete len:293 (+) comp11744_c0_seq1:151-1029(+)